MAKTRGKWRTLWKITKGFLYHQLCFLIDISYAITNSVYILDTLLVFLSYYWKHNFLSSFYGCFDSFYLITFHGSNNSTKAAFVRDLDSFLPCFLKIISIDISSLLHLPNSLIYSISVHLHFRFRKSLFLLSYSF